MHTCTRVSNLKKKKSKEANFEIATWDRNVNCWLIGQWKDIWADIWWTLTKCSWKRLKGKLPSGLVRRNPICTYTVTSYTKHSLGQSAAQHVCACAMLKQLQFHDLRETRCATHSFEHSIPLWDFKVHIWNNTKFAEIYLSAKWKSQSWLGNCVTHSVCVNRFDRTGASGDSEGIKLNWEV